MLVGWGIGFYSLGRRDFNDEKCEAAHGLKQKGSPWAQTKAAHGAPMEPNTRVRSQYMGSDKGGNGRERLAGAVEVVVGVDAAPWPEVRGRVRAVPEAEGERGEGRVWLVRGLDGVDSLAREAVEDCGDGLRKVPVVEVLVVGAVGEDAADVVCLELEEGVEEVCVLAVAGPETKGDYKGVCGSGEWSAHQRPKWTLLMLEWKTMRVKMRATMMKLSKR